MPPTDVLAPPAPTQAAAPVIPGVIVLDERGTKIQRRLTAGFAIAPLVGLVLAIIGLWGWGVSAVDLSIALGFYLFTGFGITVGYHRLFTHRSFEAPAAVRATMAVAGSMSVQGSVISWVATHRRHHAFTDREGDPHSPHLVAADGVRGVLSGLWHAHLGWLFAPERTDEDRWAPDLVADPVTARVNKLFAPLTVATFVLPALLGFAITGRLWGGVTAFLWGALVRIFLLHHVTWSINSVCHFYGKDPFKNRDESRNNWPLSVLSFGESWHNNHHAFPTSARHGLLKGQFDSGWVVIRSLQLLRLARNVHLPTPRQLERRRASTA